MSHIFDTYSKQILAFKLSGQHGREVFSPEADIEKATIQHLKFAERRSADALIIFGFTDGKLIKNIALNKQDHLKLIICGLYPDHIRTAEKQVLKIISETPNTFLLTDSSMWSILMLLGQNGYNTANCHLILNPDLRNDSKTEHQKLQKIFSGLKEITLPETNKDITISGAAILSPNEPDLDKFINSFPGWLHEIILVWDCCNENDYPKLSHQSGVRIINRHHPLNADFGKQRNRMLSRCSGEWIFYLDADERLHQEGWALLRSLASYNECSSWYLPRLTFYPDENHCRAGYGLWPDLQMRFFRNSDELMFENKIHEQLQGLKNASGIASMAYISHLTHLLKSRSHIESKLESFNVATDGRFKHQLGKEFPNLATSILKPLKMYPNAPVILPELNF